MIFFFLKPKECNINYCKTNNVTDYRFPFCLAFNFFLFMLKLFEIERIGVGAGYNLKQAFG